MVSGAKLRLEEGKFCVEDRIKGANVQSYGGAAYPGAVLWQSPRLCNNDDENFHATYEFTGFLRRSLRCSGLTGLCPNRQGNTAGRH